MKKKVRESFSLERIHQRKFQTEEHTNDGEAKKAQTEEVQEKKDTKKAKETEKEQEEDT